MKKSEYLDAVRFKSDGAVWSNVHVNPLVYEPRKKDFDKLASECPHVNFTAAVWHTKEERKFRDPWGYLWHYPGDWLDGQVIEFPLEDWATFGRFKPPDPSRYDGLLRLGRESAEQRKKGQVVGFGVEHGFFFLKLTYLRGFNNLMIDIAEEEPRLEKLCSIITEYWLRVLERAVESGIDVVYFGDDLGAQTNLPISPAAWRRYIKPGYTRIFSFLRQKGIEVFLHTDGWILDIIPDLLESGVTILNPQDTVNGLDNLSKILKGKAAIELDIDRQHITFSGTPGQIEAHVKDCVETLGSPKGGLFLTFGAYPGTPAENAMAVMRAMEKYHGLWSKQNVK